MGDKSAPPRPPGAALLLPVDGGMCEMSPAPLCKLHAEAGGRLPPGSDAARLPELALVPVDALSVRLAAVVSASAQRRTRGAVLGATSALRALPP